MPPAVRSDGTCPTCGTAVDHGRRQATTTRNVADGPGPIPWHLWVLAGALALYLGYRALQGIEWLARQL